MIQNKSVMLQHENTCAVLEKEKARIQQDLDEYVSDKAAEVSPLPLCSLVEYTDQTQIGKQQMRHNREIQALQNEFAQASRAAASHARKQNATVSEMQKQVSDIRGFAYFEATKTRLRCSWIC